MKFKSNFVNAVSLCKLNKILPIRNKNFIPLPVKDFTEIVGPGAGYPVGIFCGFAVAGAT